jgi:hypothetical protein
MHGHQVASRVRRVGTARYTEDGESYHFLTAMTLSQVSVQFRGLMAHIPLDDKARQFLFASK